MSAGKVEQIAGPRDLYERPGTRFVAEFIGISNMIALTPTHRSGGLASLHLGEGSRIHAADPGDGRETLEVTVRPEKIRLDPGGDGGAAECRVRGRVVEAVYLGSMTQVIVEAETGDRLVVHVLNDSELPPGVVPGAEIALGWEAEHSYVIGTPA